MVCPKCGKDSAGAKFCPECGQDLRTQPEESNEDRRRRLRASKQAYCPYCLSTNVELDPNPWLGNGSHAHAPLAVIVDAIGNIILRVLYHKHGKKCICKSCGAQWHVKRAARHERYAECVTQILGEYPSLDFTGVDGGYLQLSWDEVAICRKGKRRKSISFENLAVVELRECRFPFYGRLTIRDKAHKNKACPKTLDAARKDPGTILYEYGFQEGFQQVYSVLKKVIEQNSN